MKITRRQLQQIIAESSSSSLTNILKNEGVEWRLYAVWEGDQVVLRCRFGQKVVRAEMNTSAFKGTGSEPKKLLKSQVVAVLKKKYGDPWWAKFQREKPEVWKRRGSNVIAAVEGTGTAKLNNKFSEGKPESKSDSSSSSSGKVHIVKQIELALGMKDADSKWTEDGTDVAWRAWVDGKKAAIEKDYPGDIDLLKKSWSKFSKKNKSKGVKSGASGLLAFIKKYGVLKEEPVNRATLYRRRYRRY